MQPTSVSAQNMQLPRAPTGSEQSPWIAIFSSHDNSLQFIVFFPLYIYILLLLVNQWGVPGSSVLLYKEKKNIHKNVAGGLCPLKVISDVGASVAAELLPGLSVSCATFQTSGVFIE